jgi:4-diphosphocytidyl-2-C-methyl-D-erythritol kinase
MTLPTRERAYAKINLCLFLGPTRPADGRHELVTLFDSVTLCDELVVEPAAEDAVTCDGVAGPNLVGDALAALRRAGWSGPPVAVRIEKRIPVAAGMGGGSADAAAILRVARRLAPVDEDALVRVAASLGADVPAQLDPGPSLGTGGGEVVEPLAALPAYGVLVLPQAFALSTPAVYREADRLGLGRTAGELADLRRELAPGLADRLIVNDLQPAAVSLAPAIGHALGAARQAGAGHVLVCGSGPTVIGLFPGADGPARAAAAAEGLRSGFPRAVAAVPVGRGVRAQTANE